MKGQLEPVDKFDEQIIYDEIDSTKEEINNYEIQEPGLEAPEETPNELLEDSQQGKSSLNEDLLERRLGASKALVKRVIPSEVEDTEFNNMSPEEKLDTIKNNIFQFVAFVALFFVFLQILFGSQ